MSEFLDFVIYVGQHPENKRSIDQHRRAKARKKYKKQQRKAAKRGFRYAIIASCVREFRKMVNEK